MVDELKLLVKNTSKLSNILTKISTNDLKILIFIINNELDTRKLDNIKLDNILDLEDICIQLEKIHAVLAK